MAMTGFNISDFTSDIRTRGVVRTNSFLAYIVPPRGLRNKYGDTKKFIIRCDSASIPSASLINHELYRYGYGVQESAPYSLQFEPINLSFIMDSQAEIYTFFYRWMNTIINYNTGSRGINSVNAPGHYAYEVGYKSDYATQVRVAVYNEKAQNIIQITLNDAFPTSISEIQMNWADDNQIVKINVPMYYRDFSIETINPMQLEETFNTPLSTLAGSNVLRPGVVDTLNSQGISPDLAAAVKSTIA